MMIARAQRTKCTKRDFTVGDELAEQKPKFSEPKCTGTPQPIPFRRLARKQKEMLASLRLAVVLLLLGGASNAQARSNDDFYRFCSNPNHFSICTAEERNRRLAAFGLPPMNEQIRRARRKGIDGEIIVALITRRNYAGMAMHFTRDRKGRSHVSVIRREYIRGRLEKWSAKADLAAAEWSEMTKRANDFDQPVDVDKICVGGSLFAIEYADRDESIRAHLVDSCYGSPTSAYLMALADIAVNAFPECAAKRDDYEARSVDRLFECFAKPE